MTKRTDAPMPPTLPREPVAYTNEAELMHLLRDGVGMMYKDRLKHRAVALYAVPISSEESNHDQ